MSTKIKIGDRVRVLRNRVKAQIQDTADISTMRYLKEGDVIDVADIREGLITFDDELVVKEICDYFLWGNSGSASFVPLEDVELFEETTCVCDILVLMHTGCKCGAFQAEQAKLIEEIGNSYTGDYI